MQNIESLSDEELSRPGPGGIVDERAAEEAGISLEEMVRIQDIWMRHAAEVARERAKRGREKLASPNRVVLQ